MDRVVAGMATFPPREASLRRVLPSLAGQVDEVHLYLNGYQKPLRGLPSNVRQRTGADLQEAGRYAALDVLRLPYYFLSCDDDLVYPPDYAARTVAGIERYSRRFVVAWHGRRLKTWPIDRYYSPESFYHFRCLHRVGADGEIHVPGGGVCGWHSDTLDASVVAELVPGLGDVALGRALQRRRVGAVVLAHEATWLEHVYHADSLYSRYVRDDGARVEAVNAAPWTLYAMPQHQ